jgi:hypothetical protein
MLREPLDEDATSQRIRMDPTDAGEVPEPLRHFASDLRVSIQAADRDPCPPRPSVGVSLGNGVWTGTGQRHCGRRTGWSRWCFEGSNCLGRRPVSDSGICFGAGAFRFRVRRIGETEAPQRSDQRVGIGAGGIEMDEDTAGEGCSGDTGDAGFPAKRDLYRYLGCWRQRGKAETDPPGKRMDDRDLPPRLEERRRARTGDGGAVHHPESRRVERTVLFGRVF